MPTKEDLEKQIAELTEENEDLGTQVQSLTETVERLTQSNTELTEKNAALQEGADKLEQELTEMKEGEVKPSSKKKRGEEIPDFMKPSYTGKLTMDQAEKRRKAGVEPEAKKSK